MTEKRSVLIASEAGISIRSIADIVDAVGACLGVRRFLLTEADLAAEFFDLRSGLAGELLQKLVNYRVRTAIVVPARESYGERIVELAREHDSHPLIRFVGSRDEAVAWLSR